jgi:diguanylate cyclase (GGDEF)-like protein
MLDCTAAQVLGKPFGELIALQVIADGPEPFALATSRGVYRQSHAQFKTLRGAEFAVEYVLSAVESGADDKPTSFVLVFQDITERLNAEKALRRAAELDHLTGLANRLLFERKMHQVLGRPEGHNRPFGLLLMDLDGFKSVNDNYGHAVGDFLLKGVAGRLREVLRTADLPARLGGDEFAVFLDGARDPQDAVQIGQKIAATLAEPYDCGGQILKIGTSVGVALYPRHGTSVESLVKAADAAMYRAKKTRDNSVVLAEG